jgi:hypothetical protein
MKTLRRRTRTITIRLSEEEHLALCQLCLTSGARSVSDLMREAMHMVLRGANRDGFLGIYWDDFRSQIRDLDKKIEQLAVDFSSFKANREC